MNSYTYRNGKGNKYSALEKSKRKWQLYSLLFRLAWLAFMVIFIAALCFGGPVIQKTHQKDYTTTITSMVVKNDSNSSKYLVFTKNDEGQIRVFENCDSLFFGKYNSSDLQASLQVGKKYNFHVAGLRWPFMSWYENIITATEVK